MTSTAVDWGPPGPDNDYGAGRLDAYAALRAVGAPLGATGAAVPAHTFRSGTLAGTGASTDITLDVTDTQFPIAATMISRASPARPRRPRTSTSRCSTRRARRSPRRRRARGRTRSRTGRRRPGTYTLRVDLGERAAARTSSTSRPARARRRRLLRLRLRRRPRRLRPHRRLRLRRRPDGAGRADAQLGHGGAGGVSLALERAGLERRLGDHRLQGLPRHLERRRDAPRRPLGTGTSYNDTAVTAGATYYYKVAAVNAVGEGAQSNERSASRCPTVPGAPTLELGHRRATASVSLGWSAPGRTAAPRSRATTSTAAPRAAARRCLATLGTGTSYTDTGRHERHDLLLQGVGDGTPSATGAHSNERSATPAAPGRHDARRRSPAAWTCSSPARTSSRSTGRRRPTTSASPATRSTAAARSSRTRDDDVLPRLGPPRQHDLQLQVRAVDAAGNRSTASNNLSARTASQSTSTKGILAGVVVDSSGHGTGDAIATFTSVERRDEERRREQQGRLVDLEPRTPARAR